jgi:hypothetical protein
MMPPTFEVALFRKNPDGKVPLKERQRSQAALLWMMEALCRINQDELAFQVKAGKPVPRLYEIPGMRYLRENGTENWQDVYRNVELRYGDCEDLACHRISELRFYDKIRAAPFVTYTERNGAYYYHALGAVMTPNGWRIEDPSRKLGMGWEPTFAQTSEAKKRDLRVKMDRVQRKISPKYFNRLKEVSA